MYFIIIFFIFLELTDPVGDVMRHINQFEENYGEIHPVFYRGTYSQALNDAKNELRFLLVHLHSENDTDSVSFCRYAATNVKPHELYILEIVFLGKLLSIKYRDKFSILKLVLGLFQN